jgi:phage protein D
VSVKHIPVGYQPRLGTRYSVEYPDFPSVKLVPHTIELRQNAKYHDEITLKYLATSKTLKKGLRSHSPVRVTWTNGLNIKGEFFGYVTDVKETTAGQNNREFEVIATGPSFFLKETDTKVYVNKTISEVVSDVAKKNKLKTVITPSPARYSVLSQHGKTYWQFLSELAHRAGYVFYVKGTTVYFLKWDTLIDKAMGTIPVLYYDDILAAPFHSFLERTLDKFRPTTGDWSDDPDLGKKTVKNITGVDPITGKSFSSQDRPTSKKGLRSQQSKVLFSEQGSRQVTNSPEFAKTVAKAKAEQARFTMPAEFKSQGDPRISPYGVVEIAGVDDLHDGYWIVKSVTHVFNKTGHYACNGVLVTDGRNENIQNSKRYNRKGAVPVLNLSDFDDGDTLSLPKSPVLSVKSSMFNQNDTGYSTLNSRKWVN